MDTRIFGYEIQAAIDNVWPSVSVALLAAYPNSAVGEVAGLYRASVVHFHWPIGYTIVAQLQPLSAVDTRLMIAITQTGLHPSVLTGDAQGMAGQIATILTDLLGHAGHVQRSAN